MRPWDTYDENPKSFAHMAVAVLGGAATIAWAGYVYILLFPLQTINGRIMGSRRRRNKATHTSAGTDDGGS